MLTVSWQLQMAVCMSIEVHLIQYTTLQQTHGPINVRHLTIL
uniref:Uncharacterized protein n=1 Tax=Anguilla anguilla TaxID=7936 RepID=A0A0E9UJA0_ANGAN